MKYGEIYDCRRLDEAKTFIGKKVIFSDNLWNIEKRADSCLLESLAYVREAPRPFGWGGNPITDGFSQFFRPVLEEDPSDLMTYRQLSRWLSEGHGEWKWETEGAVHCGSFLYDTGHEDEELPFDVRVRRWDSDEWIEPTAVIYKEDCE